MIPVVWVALGVATTAAAGVVAWRRYTRQEDRLALPEPEGRLVVVKERKSDGHLLSVRLDNDPGLHISWPQSALARPLAPLPGARALSDPVARRLLASGLVEAALRPLEPLGDTLLQGRELQLRKPGKLGEAEAWLLRAAEALDKAVPLAREQDSGPASLSAPDLRAALVDHAELRDGFEAPCAAWIQDFADRSVHLEAPLRASLDPALHMKTRGPLDHLLQQLREQWLDADQGRFEDWLGRSFELSLPKARDRDPELNELWQLSGELPGAWTEGSCREALIVLAGLGAEVDATRVSLRVDLDDPSLARQLLIVARAGQVLSGSG